MSNKQSQRLIKYRQSLDASINWLGQTVKRSGGSSAVLWPFGKWSPAYPETTGYIIKTLVDYSTFAEKPESKTLAIELGEWLLDIQEEGGYWCGGTYPYKNQDPSVFNTGQILIGLAELARSTGDPKWLEAATKGATWLADNVNDDGQWSVGNYVENHNPSYYTRVAWPMLEVWELSKENVIRDKAERVLATMASRKKKNGVIAGWGFKPDQPAFTHTIAYTIRGFMEAARIVDNWDRWGTVCQEAIEVVIKKSELSSGQLPGRFSEDWKGNNSYVCLTGNAQLAICLLLYMEQDQDLRILNAACKLVDYVCDSQSRLPLNRFRGAIAGSRPLRGDYMKFRYPNWAAKFHCDSLMLLTRQLVKAGLE